MPSAARLNGAQDGATDKVAMAPATGAQRWTF